MRHLGNDFVLTEGFSSGRIARGMPAPSRSQRAIGFPEVFRPGAITEFIRADKIRASVSEVTCKVSLKIFDSSFNDFLIRRDIILRKVSRTEERIFFLTFNVEILTF